MSSMAERLLRALNSRDAAQVAALFAEDYKSDQPLHPGREFVGRPQVLANWTAVFQGVPDFRSELVASSIAGDTEWYEWIWVGRHSDGSPFAMRGVTIFVIRDDLIASGRLYMEPVDPDDGDIESAVRELYKPPSSRNTDRARS